MDQLLAQINLVSNSLPIIYPAQLYLRKGDMFVEAYDPVNQIILKDHSIDIVTNLHTYNHSFDAFDRIYIVPNGDEPAVTNNVNM